VLVPTVTDSLGRVLLDVKAQNAPLLRVFKAWKHGLIAPDVLLKILNTQAEAFFHKSVKKSATLEKTFLKVFAIESKMPPRPVEMGLFNSVWLLLTALK